MAMHKQHQNQKKESADLQCQNKNEVTNTTPTIGTITAREEKEAGATMSKQLCDVHSRGGTNLQGHHG
jgi:hypothetical protein